MVQQPGTAHTSQLSVMDNTNLAIVRPALLTAAHTVSRNWISRKYARAELDAVESAVVDIIAYAWSPGRKCRAGGYM